MNECLKPDFEASYLKGSIKLIVFDKIPGMSHDDKRKSILVI